LHVWTAVSEVSEVVWVLDEALAVVSEVAVAGIAAVVGSDVAVAKGGSGCGTRGWGVCSGAVGRGRLGRVCRRLRAAGGKVVVVVVKNVGCADGGCVGVVSGDVAALAEMGLVTGAVGAEGSPQACEAVLQVLGSSVDVPASFSRRGGTSVAVCIAASKVGVVIIWEATSAVMGATWVAASVVSRVRGVDTSREAQRPSPWFDTQFSFSSRWPCFFPSSSTSSILSSTSTPHCR
jgi:hypothetical protein